jgi:hypothetical protein
VVAASTSVSRFIAGLGSVDVDDTNRLLIACVCVLAIARDLHPSEILETLAESFDEDDWDELKKAILLRDFEKQMGAAAATPVE